MENGRLLLLGNIFSKSYQLPVGQRWGAGTGVARDGGRPEVGG